ncbi:MAG: hypothetical protein K1X88_13255 [Nannocystaceae bacterium]|nr:hypothetical protein [Nannocystaceae bacterium]
MAGVIVELFPRRSWDFGQLAPTGVVRFALVHALPVADFSEASLQLRSHGHTMSSGQSIRLRAFTAAPYPETPQTLFWASATALADISLTSVIAAPTLLLAPLPNNFGGHLYLDLTATMGSSTVALSATLSAQLVLKRRRWQ